MAAAEPPEGAGPRDAHASRRAARPRRSEASQAPPPAAGELLEALGVAAVVLDADGRTALWSAEAEELLGYAPREALGRPITDFVAEGTWEGPGAPDPAGWEGVLAMRRKDGGTRVVELRTVPLRDRRGRAHTLALTTEERAVRQAETDIALAWRLVSQSPIGLAVFDLDLRYVSVNPALERIHGVPARDHVGRTVADVLPDLDHETVAAAMREVLDSGLPMVDRHVLGRTPADPGTDRAWSASFYRLDAPGGRVIGLAASVVDITERLRSAQDAAQARQRLSLVADASQRIGTTLDLDRTARELAELCVPALADVAGVHVLDSVLSVSGASPAVPAGGRPRRPAVLRALAVVSAHPTAPARAADPTGEATAHRPDRLLARCATDGTAILVPHVTRDDLARIARDGAAAGLLAEAGVHSYLAVPLTARGEVLGVLDLERSRNPLAFTKEDQALAAELAARAAAGIDNARWYRGQRHAALALQHHLLPRRPPDRPGLELAYRYQPAEGLSEVGGDWFDVISLSGDRTALVVGDIMGSGINAAATMGQVRTATRTLAELDLDPDAVLGHLDDITAGLEHGIATCLYTVHDPRTRHCRLATAGHLPPVLVRPGRPPCPLDLPPGPPLGVGGVRFEVTDLDLAAGDELVMFTDGLVESRDQPIDAGLREMLGLLDRAGDSLQATCDLLLDTLRRGPDPDDVVLLIARLTGPARASA